MFIGKTRSMSGQLQKSQNFYQPWDASLCIVLIETGGLLFDDSLQMVDGTATLLQSACSSESSCKIISDMIRSLWECDVRSRRQSILNAVSEQCSHWTSWEGLLLYLLLFTSTCLPPGGKGVFFLSSILI